MGDRASAAPSAQRRASTFVEGRVVASHQSALVLHGARLWKSDRRPLTSAAATTTTPVGGQRPFCTRRAVSRRWRPRTASAPCRSRRRWSRSASSATGRSPTVPFEEPGRRRRSTPRRPGHQGGARGGGQGAQRAPRHTWRAPLLARADGRHESVGETRLAHTMRALGYRFTPQVWVSAGGRRWRADFVLDDDPVVVEFDGLAKYWGGLPDPSRSSCAGPSRRKRREDRLRGTGREMVRVVWAEADDARGAGPARRGHRAGAPPPGSLSPAGSLRLDSAQGAAMGACSNVDLRQQHLLAEVAA